ncbi:MAG: polyprenol monophosphomannose synthase [Candidatus Hydrogenedentes bacterium]|nr:polyprenol monophosphomannose synthase [Candidatus Hydrogenedentota bacterium]
MKSVIVIPTYNEAENIQPLIHAIRDSAPSLDIIVVDDGSPDGTGDLAAALERVHVIQRGAKLGLGTAYVAGYSFALAEGYDAIGGMDADFSHDPKVLPALFGLLDAYDVGIGARYVDGGGTVNWGLNRRILSRGANMVAKGMLKLTAHDVTSGYRCYRGEVLKAIDVSTIRSEGYSFLVELLYRCASAGFRIGETPIMFEDRRHGFSKLDKREIWKGMTTLARLRFRG